MQHHLSTTLERLVIEDVGCDKLILSSCKFLKEIILSNMPNLERWSSQEADDDDEDDQVIFHSPCTLMILDCQKLIYFPWILLRDLECLEMNNVGCDRIQLAISQSLKNVSLDNMPHLERWSSQKSR